MYHWKGIMEPARRRPKARKRGSLKRVKALRPKASTTLIGVPRALGGVGGRRSARPAVTRAVPAAQAKIHGDVSNPVMPRQLMPTTENTAEATQPSVPNTRMCGNAAGVECVIAIVAVSDQPGMLTKHASRRSVKSSAGVRTKKQAARRAA